MPYSPLYINDDQIGVCVNDLLATHESKANFLECGLSGAPYGTSISASDRR